MPRYVVHSHASSVEEFFLGFVAMIFNYGGLSATIEKADVMNNRSRYDYAYILAVIYSWTITLPTGIAVSSFIYFLIRSARGVKAK